MEDEKIILQQMEAARPDFDKQAPITQALSEFNRLHPEFTPPADIEEQLTALYDEASAKASRYYSTDDSRWCEDIVRSFKFALFRLYDATRPHLPKEWLGDLGKAIVADFAEIYRVSPDFIISTMFSCLSAVAGNKLRVKHGNYINTLAIWSLLVARSGYGKTQQMKKLVEPLNLIDHELRDYSSKAFAEWQAKDQQGRKPVERQLILDDSTPEARNDVLRNNPEGILLYRGEMLGFFKDINRYGQSGEHARLLSIWDGDSYRVNRKTTDSFLVESPYMSLLGGIQTDKLGEAFGEKDFQGNGFLQRWLITRADGMVADEEELRPLNPNLLKRWDALLQTIWRMSATTFTLSPSARDAHTRFYKETADEMNDDRTPPIVCEMLSKMRIMVFKLAGLLHLLRHEGNAPSEIDGTTMSTAIECCRVYGVWAVESYEDLHLLGSPRIMTQEEVCKVVRSTWPGMNVSKFCDAVGLKRDTFNNYFRKK